MAYTDAQKRQYFAIKNSLSTTERAILSYYELEWFTNHRVPTNQQVVDVVNRKYEKEGKHHRLKHTALNFYFTRRKFTEALDNRGIPWRQHSQDELTEAQVAAAVTVMNNIGSKTTEETLDLLGIPTATYYAWLKDPVFKNLIDNLADQNLANIRPAAINEFTKKINQGDWNAIKYWMETTGELTDKDRPQSEVLLRMIVEIIQKHVKDPEIIVAIAEDIKLASANRTLEVAMQPSIDSTFTDDDDEDLAIAKKKLGIGY